MFCVIYVTVFSKYVNEFCEILKKNTTVTELEMSCEHKKNSIQMKSINKSLFFNLIKSTGNNIGDTGATSLSDALKSNTPLTEINLKCEYKRKNTQMASINNPFSSN